MKKILYGFITVILAVAALFSFTACGGVSLKSVDTLAAAKRPKALSKQSFLDDRKTNGVSAETAKAIQEFSFSSMRHLTTDGTEKGNENAVFSPISLWTVLAMAAAGASGETLTELETALGAGADGIIADYPALYRQLNAKKPQIASQNSVWFSKGREKNETVLDKLSGGFLADVYGADFSDPQTSKDVRKWIKHNTKDMLDPELQFDADIVLLLINALAFDSEWKDPFKAESNVREEFTLRDGEKPIKDYMRTSKTGGYHWEDDKFVSASLPFSENFGSMYFILPDEGVTCEDIISDPELFASAFTLNNHGTVNYKVPKFEFNSKWDLIEAAQNMGVLNAFDKFSSELNFTGDSENQYIDELVQYAYIKADEKGVKAAAVTIGGMKPASAPEPGEPINLFLTRPFIAAVTVPVYITGGTAVNVPIFIAVINTPYGSSQ